MCCCCCAEGGASIHTLTSLNFLGMSSLYPILAVVELIRTLLNMQINFDIFFEISTLFLQCLYHIVVVVKEYLIAWIVIIGLSTFGYFIKIL